MSLPQSSHEGLILNVLRSGDASTMEQVKLLLPQLSWWELFRAVDALSRRGDIILRRKGIDYKLQAGSPMAAPDPGRNVTSTTP